ncbi:hypothetical protein MBLNU13_g09824t1 [Cladosporium sp. NU13]
MPDSTGARHPFAITWWEAQHHDEPARYLWIMIDPQRGWTRQIIRHSDTLIGTRAWLDGPYGQSCDFESFGCVLLFASGTGIFALLPIVKRLSELVRASAANTRRIKLVWHTTEYHDQVQVWMQSLLDDYELDTGLLSFTIHTATKRLAQNEDTGRVHKLGRRLNVVDDVPDIHCYVQLELSQPRRSLAVAVSAFSEFRHDVRAEVIRAGRDNVHFFELEYQPSEKLHFHGGSAA